MPPIGNITRALLLKHWRLCWRSLIIQQVSVLAIASLIITVLVQVPSIDGHSLAAQAAVLTSLVFLLVPILNPPSKNGRSQGVGFPYVQEFSLPVPTTLLVLVPLIFFVALMLFAYIVPITILSILFDVTGVQVTFAIILIETILVVLSLSWWSSSSLGHGIGWAVVLFLYWKQFLFLDFIVYTESALVHVSSPSAYIESVFVTAALVVIMIAGVRRQRFSENLLGLEKENLFRWQNLSVRNWFSSNKDSCPVASAQSAEWWRERQLRGLTQAIPLGILFGFSSLLTINLVSSNGGMDGAPTLRDVSTLGLAFYFIIILIMQKQVFGISYRNRQLFNTVFDRCRPMNTARLLAIKLSNNVISLVAAALAMILVIWFFGYLFIDDFADIKVAALLEAKGYLYNPFFALIRNIFLLAVMACTILFLYAVLNAWFMLKPKTMGWIISSLAIYVFLLTVTLIQISQGSEISTFSNYIRLKHLWIFILGLPIALLYLSSYLLKDKIVSQHQLLLMLVAAVLYLGIHVFDLNASGFYGDFQSWEVLIGYSMQGLTPLLAVMMCLWTMGEIRHS